jgi:hypothetical protein
MYCESGTEWFWGMPSMGHGRPACVRSGKFGLWPQIQAGRLHLMLEGLGYLLAF